MHGCIVVLRMLKINSKAGNILGRCLRLVASCWLVIITSPLFAQSWQSVAPGIDYMDLNDHALNAWSHIHAFRINPDKNKLELMNAVELAQTHATAETFARHGRGLIAINAGFFDTHFKPLGLRVRDKITLNPLKPISWWGIFYVKENKPHVTSMTQFSPTRLPELAIQSGPRLLVHGAIPRLKVNFAERTALGITADKQIIILVTENNPLTTTAVAELLRMPLINCTDALNLDGGGSSQLYAAMGRFHLNIRGFTAVPDALIVKPR